MKCKVFVDVNFRLVLEANAGDSESVYAMLDALGFSFESKSDTVTIDSAEIDGYQVLAAIPEGHPLTSKVKGE